MVPNQYSVTWDSYKTSICGGFSSLQQNGEFVDMTLAADGHLVKVHQILIALASPYLKELINSVPSQHPVIFLNNVPHATLGLLLEYIYTGEVLVPSKHLHSFMDVAKSLHIKGLESISSNYYSNTKIIEPVENTSSGNKKGKRGIPIDLHSVQTRYGLPTAARKISVRPEPQITSIIAMKEESHRADSETQLYSDCVMDVPADNASDEEHDLSEQPTSLSDETLHLINDSNIACDDKRYGNDVEDSRQSEIQQKATNNLQFTVSIRGSLQVILNRYMYNLHSTALKSTGLKRWRCIDYRNKKCPASLVTKGNIVLSRSCLHSHSYHDKKILAKIEKNAIYSALDEVVGYKEKEIRKSVDEEWNSNTTGFISAECDSDTTDISNTKCK